MWTELRYCRVGDYIRAYFWGIIRQIAMITYEVIVRGG